MRINIIVLLFFISFPLVGQSVRASIESSEVFIGQAFEYKIIVEGENDRSVLPIKSFDGIDVEYIGISTSSISSFTMGSNNTKNTVTYSWQFTATRAGIIKIPSFEITMGGKSYRTASGEITVKDAEKVEGFHLFVETEKKEYWFGEPVYMTIKWLFASTVSNPSFQLPFIKSNDFSVEKMDPQNGNDLYRLNINGLEVLAMQSAEIYKGEQYSSLSFQLKLLPLNRGLIEIDPISLAFENAEKSTGFRTSYKSFVIPSNGLRLQVKSLPSEAIVNGKPIIMSKGKLKIDAEVSPLKVHIGDPLKYTLKIEGTISPHKINMPPLNSFGKLVSDFSIPERAPQARINENQVEYYYTIRAKNDQITEIPSIQIKYFNIHSGQVEYANTKSLSLHVLETDIVTSKDLEDLGYTNENNAEKYTLESNPNGLLIDFSIAKIGKKGVFSKELLIKSPIYWTLLLLPFILFLILWLYKNWPLIITLKMRFLKQNNSFENTYNDIIKSSVISKEIVKKALLDHLLWLCNRKDKSLTKEEILQILLDDGRERLFVKEIRELLKSFDYEEYSEVKAELDWLSVLEDYYTLTKENSL